MRLYLLYSALMAQALLPTMEATVLSLGVQRRAGSKTEGSLLYLINITASSLPQAMQLQSDTGRSDTWLLFRGSEACSPASSAASSPGSPFLDSTYGAIIPCSLQNYGGSFNFRFGDVYGPIIVLPIRNFVIPFPPQFNPQPLFSSTEETVCLWGIQAADGRPNLFGDTFLQGAYVVYNLEKCEIAIANATLNSTSSNIVDFQGINIPNVVTASTSASTSLTSTFLLILVTTSLLARHTTVLLTDTTTSFNTTAQLDIKFQIPSSATSTEHHSTISSASPLVTSIPPNIFVSYNSATNLDATTFNIDGTTTMTMGQSISPQTTSSSASVLGTSSSLPSSSLESTSNPGSHPASYPSSYSTASVSTIPDVNSALTTSIHLGQDVQLLTFFACLFIATIQM